MASTAAKRKQQESEYERGVNACLDILERYRNIPREAWNEVLSLVQPEDAPANG